MATMSVACLLSCGRSFCTGINTGRLVGMERDRCFDNIILILDASSYRVKALPLLDQCVLR